MPTFGQYPSPNDGNDDFTPGSTIQSNEADGNFAALSAYLNSQFVDDAVTAVASLSGDRLVDDSVTDQQLRKFNAGTPGEAAVQTNCIEDAAVTIEKIDPSVIFPGGVPANSVGSAQIIDGSIAQVDMDDDSVGTDQLRDGEVALAKLATDATNYIDGTGQLLARLYYTANNTFTKATYPTAKYIVVQCIGAGGAGGGCDAAAGSEQALGGFGGGGAYAERKINTSALSASESVVVGLGGTGVSNGDGNDGGDSSFALGQGYQVMAQGGKGGTKMNSGVLSVSVGGGAGGTNGASIGEIKSGGNAGENGTRIDDFVIPQGTSGAGFYGGSVKAPSGSGNGEVGNGPGAGGSGGRNAGPSGAKSGGNGFNGRVIIEVYS